MSDFHPKFWPVHPSSSRTPLLLLLVVLLLQLLGCGGGNSTKIATRGTGTAKFTINWPARTKSTRLVPSAANLIRVVISSTANGTGTVYGTKDAVRPTDFTVPPATLSFTNLPPGQFYATATAYSGYSAGTTPATPAQATASLPLTIADGQTTTSNLTMGTTITQLVGAPASGSHQTSPRAVPYPITVHAEDAGNNIVLTNALAVTVSDSTLATVGGSGSTFTLTSTGQAGTLTVTVTETEANISQSFTLEFQREIYIADKGNNRIVRVTDINGSNFTSYGTSGSGSGQFNAPNSIAVDSTGHIYIADTANNRIVRIDNMSGTNFTAYTASATGTPFSAPKGIAYAAGKIWVADTGNNRICSFSDMSGTNFATYTGTVNATTLTAPESLYVESGGRILITDTGASRIVQIDSFTTPNNYTVYDGSQSSPALTLYAVTGITEDHLKHLYFANANGAPPPATDQVVNLSTIAAATTKTYGISGSGNGNLSGPYGTAYEHQPTAGTDHIYITDSVNNRLVSIGDISGTNFTSYGTSGSGSGQFSAPTGIFVR